MNTLRVTFENDAWDFMYEILDGYAQRNICVDIDGERIQLMDIVGGTVNDTEAVLYGNAWNDATDRYDVPISIPLYKTNGECNITHINVL